MRKGLALLIPLVLGCGIGCSDGYDDDSHEAGNYARPAPATNTAVNERDRDDATLTPLDQQENATDLKITQQVRQLIVDDDSLSTTAQNVKIITVDGIVTLRGPVETAQEKSTIAAKAEEVAGMSRVIDQLEIVSR